MVSVGVSSMVAPLKRVAVRKPGKSLIEADAKTWHYSDAFDANKVLDNHKAFIDLVAASNAEILWMDEDDGGNADAVFTFDASLMTPQGAILMKPGKPLRAEEMHLHKQFYEANGISIIGAIDGEGRSEAGDTCWLDDDLLAVGSGFRTNQEGIEQLSDMLDDQGIHVASFDLPYFHGPEACLHLLSLFSPVDNKTCLIHKPLTPSRLIGLMQELGYTLIEAPATDFERSFGLSVNVLATSPGQCIMIDGFPETTAALRDHGIEVSLFDGTALCMGCEGGPTCLTRPILRG